MAPGFSPLAQVCEFLLLRGDLRCEGFAKTRSRVLRTGALKVRVGAGRGQS